MAVSLPALFLTAIFCVSVTTANAATITLSPMESSGATLVLIEGDFLISDYEQFRQKVASISNAVVTFQSDGGNLVAGIEIGRLIRLRGFSTVVADGMRCASACALAWLGGGRRLMGVEARIGFHAAYNAGSGQETGVGNALVGAYLSQLGLPDRAVVYVTQAPPNSMTWLTISMARQMGIDVGQFPPADSSPKPQQKLVAIGPTPKSVEGKLPEIIRKDVLEKLDRASCLKRTIPTQSVVEIDLNGDRIPDYIVQYDSIPCNDNSLAHELGQCGTGGCSVDIWMSTSGSWKTSNFGVVRGVSAGKILEGRNTLLIATHGSACGQDGYKSCFFAVWWIGDKVYRQRVLGRKCADSKNSWQCDTSSAR